MIPDINFEHIRSFRNSKHSGFEEMCCQLYSLEPPEHNSEFFRKDGSGGDAGVECYWKLPNNSIHGLQSKYFLDRLELSQWTQLDRSIKTAIDKHPTLSRYIVCLPRDLTDPRKQGQTSQRDKWEEHVIKWKKLAEEKKMSVEFVFWGHFELCERLTRDDGMYSGRTLYWFGKQQLTVEWFRHRFDFARANLGKRYTPVTNVELPIRELFDGLCRTPTLANELLQIRSNIRQDVGKVNNAYRSLEFNEAFTFDLNSFQQALCELDSIFSVSWPSMMQDIPIKKILERMLIAKEYVIKIRNDLTNLLKSCEKKSKSSFIESINYGLNNLIHLYRLLDNSETFIKSKKLISSNTRALLIDGDAGVGKSHLLADVAKVHLENDWPVILLLGQHLRSGNPWDTFLSVLDLRSSSEDQFLGALDSAGQAAGVRTLLLVDAINEGGGRDLWKDFIGGFLTSVKRFPHIAIAITCRTTYVDSIISNDINDGTLVRDKHQGFRGYESKAATIFLNHYGITRPNTPLLAPEFSNPLFLRTCCEALSRQGMSVFPKGVRGIKSIFDLYLDSLDSILKERMDIDPKQRIGKKALLRLAKKMASDGRGAIMREEAKQLLEEIHSTTDFQKSLLHHLITEGAIAEDLECSTKAGAEPHDVIRFTFERFSDHFIAEYLLDCYVNNDVELAFAPVSVLGALVLNWSDSRLRGVVEAMAIQVPEKYGHELILLIHQSPIPYFLCDGFLKSIVWRETEAFTEETFKLLVKLGSRNYGKEFWETILSIAAVPNHPFNADRLHQILIKMDVAVRDKCWSIYLAQNYYKSEEGEPESITSIFVQWAKETQSDVEFDTLRLCGIVITWFFTTSNRYLRDQATKALVLLIIKNPELSLVLLDKFKTVNDLYVAERLYCAIYGSVLHQKTNEYLSKISLKVYDIIFKDKYPPPHVLLRDYARGIIEYAYHRKCVSSDIDMERVRPPYCSKPWPLKIPTEEEFISSEHDDIYYSVSSEGDFGRYIMGETSKWSNTSITSQKPETHLDRVQDFHEQIAKDSELREAFKNLTNTYETVEKRELDPIKILPRSRQEDKKNNLKEKIQKIETAEKKFLNLLPENERDYYKLEIKPYLEWSHSRNCADKPIYHDINAERRWVWRRAHDLGWTAKRFETFERTIAYGRSEQRVERIGKKYQWIAWHELQARLSDNLHYLGNQYDFHEGVNYEGPWQIKARDIDPSLLMFTLNREERSFSPGPVWWRPANIEYTDVSTGEAEKSLWSDEDFYDLKTLLKVNDPDGKEWFVLEGISQWREMDKEYDQRPISNKWIQIESVVVKKDELL